MENPTQNWPTKDDTIQAITDIISEHVEGAGTTEARRAAIAVINHLAGVYDEAMKNEPPNGA